MLLSHSITGNTEKLPSCMKEWNVDKRGEIFLFLSVEGSDKFDNGKTFPPLFRRNCNIKARAEAKTTTISNAAFPNRLLFCTLEDRNKFFASWAQKPEMGEKAGGDRSRPQPPFLSSMLTPIYSFLLEKKKKDQAHSSSAGLKKEPKPWSMLLNFPSFRKEGKNRPLLFFFLCRRQQSMVSKLFARKNSLLSARGNRIPLRERKKVNINFRKIFMGEKRPFSFCFFSGWREKTYLWRHDSTFFSSPSSHTSRLPELRIIFQPSASITYRLLLNYSREGLGVKWGRPSPPNDFFSPSA